MILSKCIPEYLFTFTLYVGGISSTTSIRIVAYFMEKFTDIPGLYCTHRKSTANAVKTT
jgi:hypothetical protein